MKPLVGIEALAIALPRRYLPLEELAKARGVDADKYLKGLGVREMAVPDPGEDTVALAATAARRLLANTQIDPNRIGMVIVGTETGVDHAKPVASFVQGALGLPHGMRTFDTTHACYGGTAGLMASAEWIASGAADGRVALVVAADVARYGLNSLGEPTQGAGAVAMLVSEHPRLLELDFGVTSGARSGIESRSSTATTPSTATSTR
jgi:hydroxymethylglutaryl-CoA synthase